MLWFRRKHNAYAKASLWLPWCRSDRAQRRHLLTLGLPIAFTLFVEVSIFSLIALFLGARPVSEIAANQIAMNVAYLVATLPLSISVAATIRVGTQVGAGAMNAARRASLATILLALMAAGMNIALLLTWSDDIPFIYTDDPDVAVLTSRLLLLAALFQLADAFVVPSQGALRGYKDTIIPLLLAILAYWVITLPLGYMLGLGDLFGEPRGAEGFWVALVVGLGLSGLLMTSRLWHISRRCEEEARSAG